MTFTVATATYPLRSDELGGLLVDRWAVERWSRGAIQLDPGGPCRVLDGVDATWLGHVVTADADAGLTMRLTNPYDTAAAPRSYSFVVTGPPLRGSGNGDRDGDPDGDGDGRDGRSAHHRSRIEVTSDGPVDDRARHLCETILSRLRGMVAEIRGRRTPVQAVVVIHGIGEQLPGRTLEGFVETITASTGAPVWNQADRVSDSYELRQLTLAPSDRRPRTMFNEFYWANEIDGTTTGDVLGWLWSLMGRPPWTIPSQLRAAWAILWGLVIAVVVTAVTVWRGLEQIWWISGAATVVLGIGASFLIRYLGDAARYLSPRPRNVAIRESIRRRGVDLVRKLHESGRYQRIVLVGHSLGSVIAYDIVSQLWPEMHGEHLRPERASFRAIRFAHDGDGDRSPHSLQAGVWREMRRNTQPWLVTDLITLGSPLAHAHLLLARSADDFDAKCGRAEFAVAPPARTNSDGQFAHQRPYRSRSSRSDRTFTVLNEASPFAAVRWTNLYFPARGGIFGDMIGGPVAPVFGEWVRDVPLTSGPARWKRWSVLAHTAYWRPNRRTKRADDHVDALRVAMRLDSMKQLGQEAAKHDPLLYCRTRD